MIPILQYTKIHKRDVALDKTHKLDHKQRTIEPTYYNS